MSYRDQLRAVLEQLETDRKLAADIERSLLQHVIVCVVQEGFTVTAAAEMFGAPQSTVHQWVKRDPEFAGLIEQAKERPRAKLMGLLWKHLEAGLEGQGGRAAGQAANVLSHLHFPELRERKVDATITGAPDKERSRANLEALLGRGD